MINPKISSLDTNHFYNQINTPQKNTKQSQYPPSWFDKIIDKTVNQRDLNDTVIVPRSIFKGYLGFTIVSSLTILSGLIPNTAPKPLKILKNTLTAVGAALMTIATFHFVKPFLATTKESDKK